MKQVALLVLVCFAAAAVGNDHVVVRVVKGPGAATFVEHVNNNRETRGEFDFWEDRLSPLVRDAHMSVSEGVLTRMGIDSAAVGQEQRHVSTGARLVVLGTEADILRAHDPIASNSIITRDNDGDDAFHTQYHSFSEILDKVQSLAASAPSWLNVEVNTLGQSVEDRDILSIEFGTSSRNKVFVISCGLHAREWISPAACLWMLQKRFFAEDISYDTRSLLERIRVVMFPMVNPDGYEYSRTTVRMHRKNRAVPNNVDLNRNWDDHWGVGTKIVSAETYEGPAAFSEPEIRAVRDRFLALLAQGMSVMVGLDIHSYGQNIYRPYGWTTTLPPNENEIVTLCNQMTSAASAVHGYTYSHEPASQGGIAGAAADDWYTAHTELSIGLTLELRPTSYQIGFALPPAQIIAASEECFEATKAMMTYAANRLGLFANETVALDEVLIDAQLPDAKQGEESGDENSLFGSKRSVTGATVFGVLFCVAVILTIGFALYRRNKRFIVVSREAMRGQFRLKSPYSHPIDKEESTELVSAEEVIRELSGKSSDALEEEGASEKV